MTSTVVYRKTKWTIYFEVGTLHIRREGREVESSFSRPSIFSSIPGRTRASAARAITFSAAGLPTTATLDLRWVQPSFQSLAGPQTRHQFFRGESQVHEVAKASTIAFSVLVLTTTSFTEICDRRQLCIQRSPWTSQNHNVDAASSDYIPAYQRSFRLSTAACASVSHSNLA